MTMVTARLVLVLPILALMPAACDQPADAPETKGETTAPAAPARPVAMPDTSVANAIPARFQGVWDAETGTCDPASDLRLDIGADMITFYESVGTLRRATGGENGPVTLDLSMEGEGDTWEMTMTLDLGATGPEAADRLIVQHRAQEGAPAPEPLTLKRCPA